MASSVPTPRASPVTGMFLRMRPLRTWPTGRRRRPSWTFPSGRPRWLARMTFAPWARRALIVGIAARIRESSVTLPSASGTLKSTRTKTRLPVASKSRMVSLSTGSGVAGDGQPRRDEADEVGDAAAVAPLVVVPADDLDHRPVQDHRRGRVDDRRPGVAAEVRRDEGFVADPEDALERSLGGRPEGGVQLVDGGRSGDIGREVDDADRRRRDPQAEAVELALEIGNDQRERNRRAARRRDDVQAGGPGAAGVAVRDVEDPLVVRVAVDRVHQAALDRQQVVDDLGRGGQAVRRARGVADDVVGRGVVLVLVHAEDDRDVLALGRGTDDDLLRARGEVGPGLLGIREEAGRLEDDVYAQIAPRQGGRIALLEDLDLAPVDDQGVVGVVNGPRIRPVGRVVLEEVGIHRCVDEVVDRNHLDIRRSLDQRLERLATDPAEAVDANTNCHRTAPSCVPPARRGGGECGLSGWAPRRRSARARVPWIWWHPTVPAVEGGTGGSGEARGSQRISFINAFAGSAIREPGRGTGGYFAERLRQLTLGKDSSPDGTLVSISRDRCLLSATGGGIRQEL